MTNPSVRETAADLEERAFRQALANAMLWDLDDPQPEYHYQMARGDLRELWDAGRRYGEELRRVA